MQEGFLLTMKVEKFEKAELEIVEISADDVICGSCTGDCYTDSACVEYCADSCPQDACTHDGCPFDIL